MSILSKEELEKLEIQIEGCPVCDGTGSIDGWEVTTCTRCEMARSKVLAHYLAVNEKKKQEMMDEIIRIRSALKVAEDALEFYAERSNWCSRSGRLGTSPIDFDREPKELPTEVGYVYARGKKAREALAKLREIRGE